MIDSESRAPVSKSYPKFSRINLHFSLIMNFFYLAESEGLEPSILGFVDRCFIH